MRAIAIRVASGAVLLAAAFASAGTLSGTQTGIPAAVNLTAEGTSDWAHYGLSNATTVNRKATGGSQIGAVSLIGAGATKAQLTDSVSRYSWSDGTPTASFSSTPTGIYINNF